MSLMLVGDAMQELYRWRNSNADVLEHLPKILSDCQESTLRSNYRSPKQLVDISNSFMELFRGTLEVETSVPVLGMLEDVLNIKTFDAVEQEIHFVSREIKDLIKSGVEPKDIAILSRVNATLTEYEGGLTLNNIPYAIKFDNNSLLRQSAFKLFYALYSVLFNSQDITALDEILIGMRGVGTKFVESVRGAFYKGLKGKPSLTVYDLPMVLKDSDAKRSKSLDNILNSFVKPIRDIFKKTQTFTEFNTVCVNYMVKHLSFEDSVVPDSKLTLGLKIGQVYSAKKILNDMYGIRNEDVDFYHKTETDKFLDIFQSLRLSQDSMAEEMGNKEKRAERNKVLLSTIHSFKGMERKYIFVVSLRGFQPLNINDHESKCLYYVAFTRAKRKMYLTSSNSARDFKGQLRGTVDNAFLSHYLTCVNNYRRQIQIEKS